LLPPDARVNTRLYRTRRSLRGVAFELPAREELPEALETVHTAIYLLFNEGYLSTGDKPILRELCEDAMRLTRLLVDDAGLSNSDTVALLSLMCFTAARLDSRIDDDGWLVPLDQQDRSRWDSALIHYGFDCLLKSSRMDAVTASRYHLEAAIASRHCSAETFEATDWSSICNLYERLVETAPSPSTELNRAVAISYRDGPEAAIPIVETLRRKGGLPQGHAGAAVLANLYERAGSTEPAQRYLDEALKHARSEHERHLIELQMRRVRKVTPSAGREP
jgi:predicted RNA polymerase sigma factor